MEKISIGLEKRIPLSVLSLALMAIVDGTASPEYFRGIAMTECRGLNRVKKVVCTINRMTIRNRLLPYLQEHKEDVKSLLKSSCDRPLLYVAVMCSAYSFFYDTVAILGKFFHAQQQVTRDYLLKKLSEKYGSNRALDVAYDCVMPMLVDAGFVKRSKPGVYEIVRQERFSEMAKKIYVQSFLLNNPYYQEADNIATKPYFEFISCE